MKRTFTNRIELSSIIFPALLATMCLVVSMVSFARGPHPDGIDASTVLADAQDDGLVRDADGRLSYIVMLHAESVSSYPNSLVRESHFPSYHKVQAVNEVLDMEAYYGIRAQRMTSWASLSFTAFLTKEQVQMLARDPRVENIYEDGVIKQSFNSLTDAGAVWNDAVSGSSVRSWGKMAVNPSVTQSAGTAYVYVVDGGVGRHQDLNVVEWVDSDTHTHDCGTRTGAGISPCTAADWQYLVGCYTHGTAVAGVIGGKGIGSYGVNPGVKIISVTVSDKAADATNNCRPDGITFSRLSTALDWIQSDTVLHNNALTSVVNISLNWTGPTVSGVAATQTAMNSLANPTNGRGALVVQAAGNDYGDACAHAYKPSGSVALTTDGIIVVGAINTHGQPVVPMVGSKYIFQSKTYPGQFGFWKNSMPFGNDSGSNFGPCVDLWAPGDGIYTTVANPSTATMQNASLVYTSYGFGSGTSFSAPEISGLASLLIEQQSILRPYGGPGTFTTGAEYAVRALLKNLGSYDTCKGTCNTSIMMPTTNTLSSPQATPYGELLISYYTVPTSNPKSSENIGNLINGFDVVAHNYTQLQTGVRGYGWISWNFASYGKPPYGCTVTRNKQPTGSPSITMVLNQTSGSADSEIWNPADDGSTTWAINSTCFPNGTRVTQ